MNIVIAGMKHCGKSTHGRNLASLWQCPFVDTDDVISELYEREHGRKLAPRSIFKLHGENYFRQLEADAIRQLIAEPVDGKRVIALGGGVPANSNLGDELKQLGFIVYLQIDPEIILRRIVRKGIPPMLQGDNPRKKFMELYNCRKPYYIKFADLVIELDGNMSAQSADKEIIVKIEEKLHER